MDFQLVSELLTSAYKDIELVYKKIFEPRSSTSCQRIHHRHLTWTLAALPTDPSALDLAGAFLTLLPLPLLFSLEIELLLNSWE